MLRFFTWAMLCSLVTLTWAATSTPAKKASAKKTTAKKSASKSPARKTASKSGGKSSPRRKAVTWRNRQTAPTPDRYRQIQSALAAKGYLSPQDATGVWNQTSIDALKKFQREQNIDSSGKINSLSIIALGLGPKRETAPVKPPAPGADQ